ncbi:unnamed protein product [Strongylus vulgaris]|uniref:Uncharacterized protein n=1 Tax=Strongylus vulgaris TaxID=40348 RepID=A0A3P7IWL8_STRVU|nr:unnamed protein product [Strongylus vulgaris]
MELVLPESIVQMSVGTEYVLFRAGSGHAWIAGGDDGRRAGNVYPETGQVLGLDGTHMVSC